MKAPRDPRVQPKDFKAIRQEWDTIRIKTYFCGFLNDRLHVSENVLADGFGPENRCNLCIRILRSDPVCDNCFYQPLNTNVVSSRRVGNRAYETRSALWRDLKRYVVTENTRKDVVDSNIGTQTSIAKSASQMRSTDIDLHNHTQSAIHLRQLPSIHVISQDPPIHTISQEENSAVTHSSTEHSQPESYSESGTPRRDIRKRFGPKDVRRVSRSPELRRARSKSPRKRDPERQTVFRRLEKEVFRRLGDREKSASAYSKDSRRQSHCGSLRDTESYYQSSRSRGTEHVSNKHHNKRESSQRE
ncbi:hypothetical protein Tco_0390216 [Tanacetum coccineum]